MKHGEIWWAELSFPQESEPRFRRPVIIVQSDAFNRSKINTIICAVLTSNIRLAEAPGNVLLKKSTTKLNIDSVINISQIITVDKQFLIEKIDTVDKKILNKIKEGLKLILSIDTH